MTVLSVQYNRLEARIAHVQHAMEYLSKGGFDRGREKEINEQVHSLNYFDCVGISCSVDFSLV